MKAELHHRNRIALVESKDTLLINIMNNANSEVPTLAHLIARHSYGA